MPQPRVPTRPVRDVRATRLEVNPGIRLPEEPLPAEQIDALSPRHLMFGFEAEFEENADLLCEAMHRGGYCAHAELHRYHCDCLECSFGSGWDLRFQTDSSCSGEAISRIFNDWDHARRVMDALQEHAIANDAIPGYGSGFHVHVSIEGLTRTILGGMFVQFLRWESLLCNIATGRFEALRENNSSVLDTEIRYLRDVLGISYGDQRSYGLSASDRERYLVHIERRLMSADHSVALLRNHQEQDRHSNLNVRTRHRTWEFRLFNSTRSAWRMELFCRLAVLMGSPAFTAKLAVIDRAPQPNDNLPAFVAAVMDTDSRAGELLAKQVTYMLADDEIPTELTLV